MASESTCHKVVIITKGSSRYFWGIGLVEVLWKDFTSLLNQHLTAVITLHDVLHGFWAGCGRGTTALEAKLLQNLTSTRKAFLFEVFLDPQKTYSDLDR